MDEKRAPCKHTVISCEPSPRCANCGEALVAASEVAEATQELQAVWECSAELGKLKDENVRLRGQLTAAQSALAKWRTALIEASVVNWTYTKEMESDPRLLVNSLLAQAQKEALDPAISKEAASRQAALAAEQARVRELTELVSSSNKLFNTVIIEHLADRVISDSLGDQISELQCDIDSTLADAALKR